MNIDEVKEAFFEYEPALEKLKSKIEKSLLKESANITIDKVFSESSVLKKEMDETLDTSQRREAFSAVHDKVFKSLSNELIAIIKKIKQQS